MLTQERVKELFNYDPKTGVLIRKTGSNVGRYRYSVGDTADYIHAASGYKRVSFDNSRYRSHRIIWLLVKGYLPPDKMDHINGVRHDNRWGNLRIVSTSENNRNLKISKRNTSGVIGVGFYKARSKWAATICVNGRSVHLGYFKEKKDAINVRKEAEKKYGYHENHGRS